MVVEVGHVLGQHSLEVAAVDDQHPVQQFAAHGADPSVRPIALARGARTGVRRMGMASLAKTASKTVVNVVSRSRITDLN